MKKLYILPLVLLTMAIFSSYFVIHKTWQGDFFTLFLSVDRQLDLLNANQLDLSAFATALHLIPTMIVAILAGGILAMASMLLQALTKNPLASDSTLAVGSGAQMALLITIIFLPSFGLHGSFWVGFVGALASMGLVFLLSSPSRFNPIVMVLSGLIVNIVLGAVANVLLLNYTQHGLGVLLWGGGILTQSGWMVAAVLLTTLFVLILVIIPIYKAMMVMSLDDHQALTLGVPVKKVRLYVTVIVAGVLSVIVGNLGIIGFVGLMGATLASSLPVYKLWQKLALSFVFGALSLWIVSNLTVLFLANTGVGAGAMTALLGAPLMIYLLFKLPKQKDDGFVLSVPFDKNPKLGTAFIGLLVISMIALFFAPKVISNDTMIQVSWAWTSLNDGWLINEYRLPRTLTAMSAGIMLSVAGVVLQSLSRNPMASPEVLGIGSSTAMGIVLGFVLLPMLDIPPTMTTLFGFGIFGATLSLGLIVWLSKKLTTSSLLLVGVAISALVGAIMSIINASGNPQLSVVLSFLSGSSYYANPTTAYFYALAATIGMAWAYLLAKALSLIGFGTTIAQGRGLDVSKFGLLALLLVALLSATATFAIGALSFVGLMTPHLAAMLGARNLQHRIILSAILGAILLVVADWVGRYIVFPYEIPAGTIASLVGGLYFVGLMRKAK